MLKDEVGWDGIGLGAGSSGDVAVSRLVGRKRREFAHGTSSLSSWLWTIMCQAREESKPLDRRLRRVLLCASVDHEVDSCVVRCGRASPRVPDVASPHVNGVAAS